jgi:nucleotidyltransferase AbiEii toxin of type IV toxin-antitoxin system
MKRIAQLSASDRSDLFAETARGKGITAAAAEKDFWICWVLLCLFEHPHLRQVLRFKGGTSLSKCFNLIERFSEDIDLILDWTEVTAEAPEAQRSKAQQDNLNKQLNIDAQHYIRGTILPILNESMGELCVLEIDRADKHTINVCYPAAFSDAYLRNEIRLEIGPLANMLPFGSYAVKPYAAEVFPDLFETPEIMVDTIVAERTFWEKLTILHAEAHRPDDKPQAKRYSRHYYDVYRMLGSYVAQVALENVTLLDDVVAFKQKFYPSAWARYDLARLPTLKLIPSAAVKADLRKDYAAMQDMIFGEYVDFDTMMDEMAAFQERLNSMKETS